MDTPEAAPQTTPIYDISGPKPVLGDMPHDQVGAAVASGKYTFPKGQEVNVVSPDGTFGTVPADQAPAALKGGYQYATPSMLGAQADKETYGTPGQQVLAGAEGVAQGLAGPLAAVGERAIGVNPEDIRKRAEQNPWTHGLAEAGGFGAGMFTGASEAALLGKAGNAAVHGLGLGAEGASVGTRLAAGAARMATEMGLYQAGDEATKAVLQDPNQSVGSAISNVGLSTLIGGVAGAPFAALGMGAKSVLNSPLLKDFSDRLAFRGSNVNVSEKIMSEFENAQKLYHDMGSEVGGVNGVKAKAIAELMPEMSQKITDQSSALTSRVQEEIARLGDDPLAKRLQSSLDEYTQAISGGAPAASGVTPPEVVTPDYDDIPATVLKAKKPTPERIAQMAEAGDRSAAENLARANQAGYNPYDLSPKVSPASPSQIFDATQKFKQQLQEWGKFSKLAPPPISERAFIGAAKSLSHDFRTALENPETWGKVAELQTTLNKAWSEAIPAMKDAESKFMTRIGGEPVIDPAKFATYLNQNGKATTATIRQQMMGKFIDAVSKFHDATSLAFDRAGLENPFHEPPLTTLKESLDKVPVGAKLADLWFDKLGAQGIGNAAGAGVGGLLGHATGLPGAGLGGVYLGKEVLGPAFASVIKPMMEKGANLKAVQSVMSYSKAVLAGNHALTNAASAVFGTAGKTLPAHLIPAHADLEKFDERLKVASSNPGKLSQVASNLGDYLPEHAQAMAKTAMSAVQYLNSLRPSNPKQSPLDSEIPVSKAQKAPFYRSLSVAEQPLTVFQHMKNGTLLPQDVKTLQTLYPALYGKMSHELIAEMTSHLSDGHAVSYKTRQSMSLFLGQPMDSTMTPANMQSIQSIYSQGKAGPAPQQGQSKGSPSKLGKMSNNLRTPEQARADRANQG